MKKTAIFYGPTQGSVAKVAKLIASALGTPELVAVKQASPGDIDQYSHLILGISTIGRANWDSEHKDTDWDNFLTQIEKANWQNKTVAIFGLGDQMAYPDNFVDAIGWLYDRLAKLNVKIVGQTSAEGYQFNDSEGFRDNQFLGLPVDEDSEPNRTNERVSKWVEELKKSGF